MAGKRVVKARVLTGRDREILKFVGQGGIASLRQLHVKFWEHARERTAYERLSQLSAAGYLVSEHVHARQPGEQAFILTRKGAAEFSSPERRSLIIDGPADHELKQQLYAQDARLILEGGIKERGGQLLEWKNERELRREQRLTQEQHRHQKIRAGFGSGYTEEIPDARVIMVDGSDQGQTVEVDIEIDGAYFGKMLRDKIQALGKTGRPVVWVTTPGRAERIRSEIGAAKIGNISLLVVGE